MLEIRPLTQGDIPAALRLSTQAGWNQIEADWRRLLGVFPGHCLGGRIDGQLIATGTLATYRNRLGWVGMILVDEAFRSRGYGSAMLDAIITLGERLGIEVLGLDATGFGRPLYEKRGFVAGEPINRWSGAIRSEAFKPSPGLADWVTPVLETDWDALLALDREVTTIDRSRLLRAMASEAGAMARIAREEHAIRGFAFARRGRTAAHIGPVISQTPEAAVGLIDSILDAIAGTSSADSVLIDILCGNPLEPVVWARGFTVCRRLTRMFRPAVPAGLLPSSMPIAAACFALG